MKSYDEMKKKLLFYTATVGCVGVGLAYVSIGPVAAMAFASGSLASFGYQLGLQKKVDAIGKDTQETPRLLSALPFIGVGATALLVYTHTNLLGMNSMVSMGHDNVEIGLNDNFSLTMALLAGFASQKLSIILFSVEGVKYPLLDLEGKYLQ